MFELFQSSVVKRIKRNCDISILVALPGFALVMWALTFAVGSEYSSAVQQKAKIEAISQQKAEQEYQCLVGKYHASNNK
jgi:hypothetical protein